MILYTFIGYMLSLEGWLDLNRTPMNKSGVLVRFLMIHKKMSHITGLRLTTFTQMLHALQNPRQSKNVTSQNASPISPLAHAQNHSTFKSSHTLRSIRHRFPRHNQRPESCEYHDQTDQKSYQRNHSCKSDDDQSDNQMPVWR